MERSLEEYLERLVKELDTLHAVSSSAGVPSRMTHAAGALEALHAAGVITDAEYRAWGARVFEHLSGSTHLQVSTEMPPAEDQREERHPPPQPRDMSLERFISITQEPARIKQGSIEMVAVDIRREAIGLVWMFVADAPFTGRGPDAVWKRESGKSRAERVAALRAELTGRGKPFPTGLSDDHGNDYEFLFSTTMTGEPILGRTFFGPGLRARAKALRIRVGDDRLEVVLP
jgi:hypothetical protein